MSAVDSTARTDDNASRVDKGSSNLHNSIIYEPPRKKTTSLWSYMLPTHANENTNNTPNCNEPRLPTTSPSDRNAASIRLMVGDAQASVQHLSNRVDKLLDLQRLEANKLEQVIGGVVQSVERASAAVAESNAAHASKLAEALTRCARLEEALVAQSNAINELGAKCDLVLSQTSQSHATVLSLAPAIDKNQLEADRSSRLLSAETKQWMSEHVKETSAGLDRVREELKRAVEAWDGSLSLHRQETSVMFSAVLAGIKSVSVVHTRIPLDDGNTVGTVRGSETSRSGLAPAHTVDTTPPTTHGPLSSSDLVEEPHQHAAKNRTSSSRHSQPSPVHGKNSTPSGEGRVLVEETQSTALSSVPDEDLPDKAMTFERQGFGALSKRTSSVFASFANPGSPGFTVQRRPFVQGSTLHHAPNSSELQAETRAPTLGRSSPNEGIPSLRLTLNKRAARVEEVPPGTTKRSRKNKTRVLMDSQELLRIDSSPER
ncbi:unnamed protein product [Rhizoctonia solani]|uniref:Uncharacterized protein n=1 Tax=Rhizoctonia solani TaxID=456999 RepID=A0A8H3CBM6_9AGAM|nr:unnamed protein product [Rhizoctonia solani]